MGLSMKRWSILLLIPLLAPLVSMRVHAQSLEDAIEAEVDQLKRESMPSVLPQKKSIEASAKPNSPAPAPARVAPAKPSVQAAKKKSPTNRAPKSAAPSEARQSEEMGARIQGVDSYVVQAGDTFFEISKTFFGDGHSWRRLWAANKSIQNPNNLKKGQVIRLTLGNEENAPGVAVVQGSGETIKVNEYKQFGGAPPVYLEQAMKELPKNVLENGTAVELDELVATPELPPVKRAPLTLRDLPPSFQEPKHYRSPKFDSSGVQAKASKNRTVPPTVYVPHYLADRPVRSLGKVVEAEAGDQVAATGQIVYVRLEGSASTGQKFMSVRAIGKIEDPERGPIGPLMEIGGIIEIIAPIDTATKAYRALVLKAINPLSVGSDLIDESLPMVNYSRQGTLLSVDVRILGGGQGAGRTLFGESETIYLDGGAKAGMAVGDLLPIQSKRATRREDSEFPEFRRRIGVAKVIKVEPTVATAVVIEAKEEIFTGDRTGGVLSSVDSEIESN